MPSKVELLEEISRIRDVHKEDFVEWANKLGADVRAYWTWDEIIDEVASGRKVTKQDLENYLARVHRKRRIRQKELSFEEEHIKEKIIEREISRRKVSYKETIFDEVVDIIENTPILLPRGKPYEMNYEIQLWQRLNAYYPNAEYERRERSSRFDISIGNEVLVELKRVYGNPRRALGGLYQQIVHYKNTCKNMVIVLLIDSRVKKDALESEIRNLYDHARNNRVNLKIIKKEVAR